jgi:hypothetical protein
MRVLLPRSEPHAGLLGLLRGRALRTAERV